MFDGQTHVMRRRFLAAGLLHPADKKNNSMLLLSNLQATSAEAHISHLVPSQENILTEKDETFWLNKHLLKYK